MSKSIKLSPKHGVNPTIPVCFWCGKPKNEIALMGRIWSKDPLTGDKVRGSDLEAPKYMCIDMEPCEECAENFGKGLLLMECVEHDNGKFPVTDCEGNTHYLTGRWAVKSDERNKGKRCLIDTEVFNQVLEGAS